MKTFCCVAVLSLCLFSVALAKTECEEHREREMKSNTLGKFVPRCDENGDYEALQCHGGTQFCMCWRPDGSHITAPSTKIQTCACHAHRDRELRKSQNGFVGNFIPSCEENGTYSRRQCHSSTGLCWCSDENGKRVSEQTRGEANC